MGFFKKKVTYPALHATIPIHPVTNLPIENIEEEIIKCATDPKYFINCYAYTKNPKKGVMRFELYPFQNDTIASFQKHKRCVILKSRQMGISWLSAAYCAWFIIFKSSRDALCIANRQKTATKMVDKVKFIIKHLPQWMVNALNIHYKVENRESIQLMNDSILEASATTENAARGDSLGLLIVDEAASIRRAEETWTSLEPALEVGNAQCIILSTPKGVGNWFHTTFVEAENEINDFYPIVLGYELHPDRDPEKYPLWAKQKIRQRGEKLFAREYACQFEQSGNTLINAKFLSMIEHYWVKEPEYKGEGPLKGLWVWEEPIPGDHYIVSADIAAGEDDVEEGDEGEVSPTDNSSAVVIHMATRRIVAEYYNKIRPVAYAELLYNLCNKYNQALFTYDATGGYGGSFFELFRNWGYMNIYRQPRSVMNKYAVNLLDGRNKAGFTISKSNREDILLNFESNITERNEDEPLFYSKRMLNELKTFVWMPKQNKYNTLPGKHDDAIFAASIGFRVLQQWSMYHGNNSSMASHTLGGLKARRRMNSPLPGGFDKGDPNNNPTMPVTLSGLRKRKKMMEDAFIDKQSGEDLRQYLGNVKTDYDEPQRDIFSNPIG